MQKELKLEIKSNKGVDSVNVNSTETLYLYIKTNKECYLRVIYILADGEKILLIDDLKINVGQVGKYSQIGNGFIPDIPFGKEELIILGSTISFDPIETRLKNGYAVITEGLPQALSKSKAKGLRHNIEEVEARLTVYTQK